VTHYRELKIRYDKYDQKVRMLSVLDTAYPPTCFGHL